MQQTHRIVGSTQRRCVHTGTETFRILRIIETRVGATSTRLFAAIIVISRRGGGLVVPVGTGAARLGIAAGRGGRTEHAGRMERHRHAQSVEGCIYRICPAADAVVIVGSICTACAEQLIRGNLDRGIHLLDPAFPLRSLFLPFRVIVEGVEHGFIDLDLSLGIRERIT